MTLIAVVRGAARVQKTPAARHFGQTDAATHQILTPAQGHPQKHRGHRSEDGSLPDGELQKDAF